VEPADTSGLTTIRRELDGGVVWHVVRWNDGSAARFLDQWMAVAASRGWLPPPGVAHRVPDAPFPYE
jgi:hypothetical protein